jgi:hypothetical protein
MLRWLVVVATFGVFFGFAAQFHRPGQGFTPLIMFGSSYANRYIPELAALNYYKDQDPYGYDAQWYVQIAMHPRLTDPVMQTAIDNLPYRARRILFCMTAYALGQGQPAGVLQAYAVQNIICWPLLGVLLLWRWFRPNNWSNVFRWVGVMLSFGVCFSVRGSLVDGPSLLVIAIGMALFEAKRPWLASIVFGLGGLAKETNVLVASIFAKPENNTVRSWIARFFQGVIVVLPLVLWIAMITHKLGTVGTEAGARNFSYPLVGYWHKVRGIVDELKTSDSVSPLVLGSLGMVISLTTQLLFLLARPRWRDAWWRLGLSYGLLMVMLGDAVWEGYPGAASRVLLPMLLAFNILVPRGRWWFVVLVLGNLTVFNSSDLLRLPGGDGYKIAGSAALRTEGHGTDQRPFSVTFDDRWYGAERTQWDYWRWSKGSAAIVLNNPHPFPVLVRMRFAVNSLNPRDIRVTHGEEIWWTATLGRDRRRVDFKNVVIPPGETVIQFESEEPSESPSSFGDPRKLAFRMYNFELQLLEKK